MKAKFLVSAVLAAALSVHPARAADLVVRMHLVDDKGVGTAIGTVTVGEGPQGLVFTPDLKGLAPGSHGFHVHQNPDCSAAVKDGLSTPALAAGGHYDPAGSGKHEGPAGNGHLGDLPALTVAADGAATAPVVAARLRMADVLNRSLMIHAGGDNYADVPAPLGGGGTRIVCGVIE